MDMETVATKLDLPSEIITDDIDIKYRVEIVLYNRNFRRAVTEFRRKWSIDTSSSDLPKVSKADYNAMQAEIAEMARLSDPPLFDNWEYVLFKYLFTNVFDLSMPTHDTGKAKVNHNSNEAFNNDYEKLRREIKTDFAPYRIYVVEQGLNIKIRGRLSSKDWDNIKNNSDKLLKRHFPTSQINRSAKNVRLMAIAKDLSLQTPKLSYKEIAGKLYSYGYPEVTESSAKKLIERSKTLSL